MKRLDLKHSLSGSITNRSTTYEKMYTVLKDDGFILEYKLADRMKERGLTVRALASMTGLRLIAISEYMTGNKGVINMYHISVIMLALRITDIREIFDIKINPDKVPVYNEEANIWKYANQEPEICEYLRKEIVNKEYK